MRHPVVALPILLGCVAGTLRAQCPDGTPPPCGRPRVHLPSVAILFMEPRSRNAADSLLAEGLTLEIINTLGGVTRLDVKSRFFSRRIAADTDPMRGARALGVDYIVDGVLEIDSARLLVRGALTRTATGRVVRPLRIERRRADIERVQEEVATEIALAVVGQLLPTERARFAARREDPMVTELLLRARPLMDQYTEAPLRQAAVLLHQAIAMDSSNSHAWSELGFCHALLRGFEPGDSEPVFLDRASFAWGRALVLDTLNGVAMSGLGWVRGVRNDLSPAVEAMARRGAALEPNPYTQDLLAYVLIFRGHLDEGLSVERALVRRDSLSPVWWVGVAELAADNRRFGEAASAWNRALALRPSHGDSLGLGWARRWARLESRDCAGALADGRAALDSRLVVESLRCLGRSAEADSVISSQLALPNLDARTQAVYLAWTGQPDSAFAILDRAFPPYLALALQHPAFDPYRRHRGYLALRRRMGFESP